MRFLGQYDLNLSYSNVISASLYFWTCLICIVVHYLLFYFVEFLCKHIKSYLIWSLSWWKLGWSNKTSTNAFIWSLWPCHSAHVDCWGQQTRNLSSLKFAFGCIWLIGFLHSVLFYELTSIVAGWYWISTVHCLGYYQLFFERSMLWVGYLFLPIFFFFTLILTLYNLLVAYVVFLYNLQSDVFLFSGSTSGFSLFFEERR